MKIINLMIQIKTRMKEKMINEKNIFNVYYFYGTCLDVMR